MQILSCKMCGSPNILQYGNIYICQNCGTRYSTDEIQKMMVVGNVNVSGSTININNSGRLNNLYIIARRARDNKNWEDAERNYNLILIDDPYSWEANYYVIYARAMQCKIIDISSAANSISRIEASALRLIRSSVNPMNYITAVNEIAVRSMEAANLLAVAAYRHYMDIDESIRINYLSETVDRIDAALNIYLTCGDEIEAVFFDIYSVLTMAVTTWKGGIVFISALPQIIHKVMAEIAEPPFLDRIYKYDRKYVLEIRKQRVEEKIEDTKEEIKSNSLPVVVIVIVVAFMLFLGIISITTHTYEVLYILGFMALIALVMILSSSTNTARKQSLKELQAELNGLQNELNSYS